MKTMLFSRKETKRKGKKIKIRRIFSKNKKTNKGKKQHKLESTHQQTEQQKKQTNNRKNNNLSIKCGARTYKSGLQPYTCVADV